ncbi:MAG TPA: polysaccharide deacetylase family protein [Chitinophagaceae bacterium]
MNPQKTIKGITLILISSALFTNCKSHDEIKKETITNSPSAYAADPAIKQDSSKRYIYLTFDDAPQPPGTMICKDIFTRQGVKATFFVVGLNQTDLKRKKIIDSIRSSYPQFLIANHGYSHGFKNDYKSFYSKPDIAIQDFLKEEKDMKIPVKIIRLPGNNAWAGKDEMKGPKSVMPVCKQLDSMGYTVIGWDIEWRFKNGHVPVQSTDEVVKEVNTKLDDNLTNESNTVVILAHDRMFAKPPYTDSLNKFIATLKQDPRNVFETIDHYPLVQKSHGN